MKIFLIRNTNSIFKFNKTQRLCLFNTNFLFYKLNRRTISDKDLEKIDAKDFAKKIEIKFHKENEETKLPVESFKSLDYFVPNRELTKAENLELLSKFVQYKEEKDKAETYHKMKIYISLFIFLLGLFSLWVPLYKTICESQGFSVKTSHQDYKFNDKPCKVCI